MNNSPGRNYSARKDLRVVIGTSAKHDAVRAIKSQPFSSPQAKSFSELSLNRLLTNHLLAALPAEDFARILPHLEPVTLTAGDDLYQFEAGIRAVYFPETAVISNLHILADGNTTEAALIGKEGLAGLSTVFNAPQPDYWTRVLIAGSALKIRTDILKSEFKRGDALQELLLLHASERMSQLSQRAVCNGLHKLEERFCYWLLMVHDRAGEDQLQLTHEQIAGHLGTRRAGITIAANLLRDEGIISYSRGLIRIIDRQALEYSACECYSAHAQMANGVRSRAIA